MSSEANDQTFTPIDGANTEELLLTEEYFGKPIYAEVVVERLDIFTILSNGKS